MKLAAAALVLGLAAGGIGAWQGQSWRYEKQIADIHSAAATALAAMIALTREEEQANFERIQDAEREARERELVQRAAAVRAAAESRGLRDDLTSLRASLPALTEAAVRERAATLGGLLGDCSERYQGMAQQADRHASDVARLLGAWPRNLVE